MVISGFLQSCTFSLSLILKLYLANYLPNAGLGEHATKLYPGNHLSSTEPHSAIDKIIILLYKCKDVYQFSTCTGTIVFSDRKTSEHLKSVTQNLSSKLCPGDIYR